MAFFLKICRAGPEYGVQGIRKVWASGMKTDRRMCIFKVQFQGHPESFGLFPPSLGLQKVNIFGVGKVEQIVPRVFEVFCWSLEPFFFCTKAVFFQKLR